jgi:isocitrate dehydrogenase (NAD+)
MKISLLPGDGIGPEVAEATVAVLEAAGFKPDWEILAAGAAVAEKEGTPIPEKVIESIKKNSVALKGPVGTPIGKGFTSVNVTLRKRLDLYANVRPVKSLPGVKSRFENVNLIIFRENTEGLYSGLEHTVVPGVVESIKVITEKASLRISEYAFNWARESRRKKVAVVHKANIMKLSDGLFLECARRVAQQYPEIEYKEVIVGNCAMQMVMNPVQFDVLVLENLYGDIISDLAAGLVGGLGLVPGANLGDRYAVFEAVHGTAPDLAGKGIANPLALIFSSVMMLRHLKQGEIALAIEKSAESVLAEGKVLTPDLGGEATTKELVRAIISRLD